MGDTISSVNTPTDHTGKTFGAFRVLELDPDRRGGDGGAYWICQCQCGTTKSVRAANLLDGQSTSCGCRPGRRTHGMSGHRLSPNRKVPPEYAAWCAMQKRCKPDYKAHQDYHDRGIHVWPGWVGPGGFEPFLDHLGHRPSDDHSLDRIDNDRGYEPGNVRWATRSVQQSNRRSARGHETEIRRLRQIIEDAGLEY